jgi:hypothetical protein
MKYITAPAVTESKKCIMLPEPLYLLLKALSQNIVKEK